MIDAASFRLIVFDWDGTVMDSAAKIVNCFHGAARTCGQPLADAAAVRRLIGLNLSDMFQQLYPAADRETAVSLIESYREYWISLDTTPMPLFPGVEQGLNQLARAGYDLAIATGKSRRGLDRALDDTNLRGLFRYSRCADESMPKPDPAMLNELLGVSGWSSKEALMVGDTTFDLEMAQRASMRAVGVGYGYHAPEMLTSFGDHPVISSFGDLVASLEK